jgi:divalent metal cation (Fe/Co/Zn/Cd) transporter
MNQSYGRLVSRAAIAATVMASALLLIKIFAWWYTGSVSILAALVDSLVDIAASLTNLLVVRYSLQPADEEHTFGHGKAESLAALAQSMFISGSALFLFLTGIQHLAPGADAGGGRRYCRDADRAGQHAGAGHVPAWVEKRKVRRCGQICFIISLML